MLVEFRCQNQISTQSGVEYCNQLLKAESKFAGKRVRCPKCEQMNLIPAKSATAPITSSPANPTDEQSAPASTGRDELAVPTQPGQAGSKTLAYSQFDPYSRCPECGSLLDKSGKCTKCRYAQVELKTDDQSLDEIDIKPAGFQLFVHQKMNKFSPKMLAIILHIAVGLGAFVTIAFALLLAGCFGLLVLPLVIIFVAAYAWMAKDVHRVISKPAQKLSGWQRMVWDLVLSKVRGENWTSSYVNPDKVKVVDCRGQDVDDVKLLMIKSLDKTTALDLEGSRITDQGLIGLRSYPRLKYLVLKGTQVTDEGVFRLQQAIPTTWIWYQ